MGQQPRATFYNYSRPSSLFCQTQPLYLVNMSLWGTLTGKKPSSTSSNASSSSSSTPSQDTAPTTSFHSTPFDPTTAQDVTSFLGNTSLPDPSQLHPLAGLNRQSLDYLSLDESALSDLPGSRSALPSRGWSDDLQYGTGVTYLSALTLGGSYGMIEGLRRTPASAPPKIRLNSVLNSITRRGPFLGNSAGIIAMVYNGINSTIGYYRGKHDSANSVAAGALSGMLFKSTRGLRPMMISGGIVAGVAGVWTVSSYGIIIRTFEMLTFVVATGYEKDAILEEHHLTSLLALHFFHHIL
ncbi:MAG: hypothetical protein L6R36_003055 [Xanthoria steineri]|nr:MAG: hypothetical protein L6R36_003055 [Xanthoria steineri]